MYISEKKYKDPHFYRVSKTGAITIKESLEEILALPDGQFYFISELISEEVTSWGNKHLRYNYKCVDKSQKIICPLLFGVNIIRVSGFINTASSPQKGWESCITVVIENEKQEQFYFSATGKLNWDFEKIYNELEIVESKYMGSIMEYIVSEANSPSIKATSPNSIHIFKSR
jgi:hypothetical protein